MSQDSQSAAIRLLEATLEAPSSLVEFAERASVVPEVSLPAIRELFVFKYCLMYEVTEHQVHIIAFLHGARDFAKWQRKE